LRRIWLSLTICLALAACGGGGGTGGGNNGGGGGGGGTNPTTGNLGGVALAADGDLATSQAPVASATVQSLDLLGTVSASTTTDATGAYQFASALGSGVPLSQSLRIVAQTGTQIVSAIINSGSGGLTRHLDDVTHLAALAMLESGQTGFSDAEILRYEQAARARLEAALVGDPTARFSLLANQAAAAALAAQIRADVDAGLAANGVPLVSSVVTTPSQFVVQGGEVQATVTASDGDALSVTALVLRPGAAAPEAVVLTNTGSSFTGTFTVPDNGTALLQRTTVYVIVDDGLHAPVPVTVRTIVVRAEGTFVLDILTETLFDEPASRSVDDVLGRLRPVYHRGDGRARRQVNPNQTIRGATCTVVDNPAITGVTGNDGLLLLNVPLSLLNDRIIAVDASIAGRVGYRQYLLLPPDLAPLEGDRIELDLVLATQNQWQTFAGNVGLGTLDYGLVPLAAFFNVRNDVSLGGVAAGAQTFRPITETSRADDGDFLFSNLPAGTATISGTFTDPVDTATINPFGPAEAELATGLAHAFAALLPPS